jgi:hypothetical protein
MKTIETVTAAKVSNGLDCAALAGARLPNPDELQHCPRLLIPAAEVNARERPPVPTARLLSCDSARVCEAPSRDFHPGTAESAA